MATSVGVHEAKTRLSQLLQRVRAGEEITITSRGVEVARLVPAAAPERRFGWDAARLRVPDDFDEPLPDDVLQDFGS